MGDGLVRRYAVILNGDTEPRHQENVDRAVRALRKEGSYDISVASTKAPREKPDRFVAAEEAKIQELIAGLKGRMDDDDLLVVYVTGHGQSEGEGCVGLSKSCLPFQKLQSQIDRLPYGQRIVVMDNCYSGNGLRLFANPKTSVVTQGSPGETVSCQTFSPYFWSEKIPDGNGDGKLSLEERYAFALEQGQTASLTQFFSPQPLSFSGSIEEKPFKTKDGLPLEVHNGAELEAQLKRLKPGQLALVDFGADWCVPCAAYEPTFNALSQQYGGKFLMIRAKRIKGSEEDWAKYGITQFPTVAFIDAERKITKVGNHDDPMDSLLLAAIHSEADRIKILSDRLDSPDSTERLRGLKGLLTMNGKSKPALSKIAKLLEDGDERIRLAACEALKAIGPDAAAAGPDLIRRLEDPTPAVAIAAAEALAAIGPGAKAALPALLRSLASKEFRQRTRAWEKARGSSEELIDQNVLDWIFEMNLQTARALSRIDREDKALPKKLLALAADPRVQVEARIAALFGLKDFGQKADFLMADLAKLNEEEMLKEKSLIGNALAETLSSICAESRSCAEFAIRRFEDSKLPPLHRYIYMHLAKANLETTELTDRALLRMANNTREDPRLRKHAALLLKTSVHAEAVRPILQELESVSVFFDSKIQAPRPVPVTKNVAGFGLAFAGREGALGGGADLWLGRKIFSGPELRLRASAYGVSDPSGAKETDLELRASIGGAWAFGKDTDFLRPVILLPELGVAHRIKSEETVFHGSPLGAALQVEMSRNWRLEFAGRASLDFGDELEVGGESSLSLMRKF